jgi:hypothetical protein
MDLRSFVVAAKQSINQSSPTIVVWIFPSRPSRRPVLAAVRWDRRSVVPHRRPIVFCTAPTVMAMLAGSQRTRHGRMLSTVMAMLANIVLAKLPAAPGRWSQRENAPAGGYPDVALRGEHAR